MNDREAERESIAHERDEAPGRLADARRNVDRDRDRVARLKQSARDHNSETIHDQAGHRYQGRVIKTRRRAAKADLKNSQKNLRAAVKANSRALEKGSRPRDPIGPGAATRRP